MYCNLSKSQALPTAFRVSSQQHQHKHKHMGLNLLNNSNLQSFSNGVYPKPSFNPQNNTAFTSPAASFGGFSFVFGGLLPKSQQLKGVRSFSSFNRNGEIRGGRKNLPWLADADSSGHVEEASSDKVGKAKAAKSPWEISADKFLKRTNGSSSSSSSIGEDEGRRRLSRSVDVDVAEDWRNPRLGKGEKNEDEVVNDSGWNAVKTRAGRMVDRRPESQRWSREESWGRKTYKEASESSVPKMVGEGLYGVGPVLAALSAGRRDFYTLYVQEGLELSKNNKKRKDKKGFEKVLKMADKMALSIREVSKHDLNMIADNRPHQGLVLDTSPLEMVHIKELEIVSPDHDKGVLWVALDEVTDPQNLGAIIRSSYFFGAAGVVLCAKNSAPLSGVVSKASAGSLELMEMRSCKNMMQFLTSSAENGWRVVGGSVSSRAVPLREVGPGEPTILVLGSEGTGLRPLVERSCTQLVRIPGNIPVDPTSARFEDDNEKGEDEDEDPSSSREEFQSFMAVESLNVSVAAGVLLHHFIGSNYMGNADDNAVGLI